MAAGSHAIEANLQGKEFSKLPLTHPARAYEVYANKKWSETIA